jgi:hypothetical protein
MLGELRTRLPPAANDNHGSSVLRVVLAILAAAVAAAFGILALHPFG